MSSKTEPSSRAWPAAVVATLALAAVLRLIRLDYGIWYDEIVTLAESARQPLAHIVSTFGGLNTHPLYSVLAHLSLSVFGDSTWALRLPAAVFGVASVAMVYVLAAQFLSRVESWVATIIIATSYHHVWFSQNARGYTVMGFLTLLSTYYLLRASKTGRWTDYAIYAIACTAGVYTHLTMAFVVAGHAVVVLGGHVVGWPAARAIPARAAITSWAAAGVASALLYAPFISGLMAMTGNESRQQAAGVATASWALSEAVRSLLAGTGVPAALVGGLFASVGAISVLWRWPLLFGLLAMPAVVTGAALVAVGQPLRPRFFFFLSATAAVFVGRGIGAMVERVTSRRMAPATPSTPGVIIVGAVLVALSAVALPTAYLTPKQDFAGAVALAEDHERQGASIVMSGPACLAIQLYYGKPWPCLKTKDAWEARRTSGSAVLMISTLTDYIEDPSLRQAVQQDCEPVHEFPATLGGGELLVCRVPATTSAAPAR